MAGKKRSAAPSSSKATIQPQRKRQAISLPAAANSSSIKRTKPSPSSAIKRSNRPGFNEPSSDSEHSDSASDNSDNDEDQEEDPEESRHAALEAALRRHQLQFLQELSLLPLNHDDESELVGTAKRDHKGKGKEVKSVWDLGMDDLEDEEDEDSEESEESDGVDEAPAATNRRVAEIVSFSEPGRSLSSLSSLSSSTSLTGSNTGGTVSSTLTGKELRDFKSGKIKSNVLAKPSVADLANVKYRGKKGGKDKKGLLKGVDAAGEGVTGGKRDNGPAEDKEEETHLSQLDSHLSSLTRSLHSNTSSLPDLLRSLPLASSKPLKGHTPLPKNAPRSLRSGLAAANLKRAQARDAAAGILPGSKQIGSVATLGLGLGSREAKSLKEKRKEEGLDKRERGMGAAVGKFGRGMISLSKGEIRRVQGMGGSGSSGSGGGGKRGGKR
ncbi:Atg39p [Sporobolomyces salmoneus]|uniref:Atg39p n=1 Tax=Sporobolomyces salmoneus TaxID=183962 RepID=UPI0031806759